MRVRVPLGASVVSRKRGGHVCDRVCSTRRTPRTPRRSMTRHRYTKELLAPVVATARSYADVLRRLGVPASGGNHRTITARIAEFEIDTTHFRGQAWARGTTQETDPAVRHVTQRIRHTDEQVFRDGSLVSGVRLRKRLICLGRKYVCAECKRSRWRRRTLVLHVDHINGVHTDNRLENLRFLCPNCHQQTETWGNRRRGGTADTRGLGPRAN